MAQWAGGPAYLFARNHCRCDTADAEIRKGCLLCLESIPDPFFWSRLGRNRFDLPDGRYGVLYTGEDLETCVIEVFGDRWLNERALSLQSLAKFEVLTFAVKAELYVADLTGPGLNLIGTDANLFASNEYNLTQQWSRQLMAHLQSRDGLRYRSLQESPKAQLRDLRYCRGEGRPRGGAGSPIRGASGALSHSRQIPGCTHGLKRP